MINTEYEQALRNISIQIGEYRLREAKAKAEAAENRAESERLLLEATRAELASKRLLIAPAVS